MATIETLQDKLDQAQATAKEARLVKREMENAWRGDTSPEADREREVARHNCAMAAIEVRAIADRLCGMMGVSRG